MIKLPKLNNKGITAIEILVCFVIVTAITVTLFDVITSYKTKQQIESYKSSITEYKNTVTKVINDDIIKYKLATFTPATTTNYSNRSVTTLKLYFKKNLLNKADCPDFSTNSACQKTLSITKYKVASSNINTDVDTISYQEVAGGGLRLINYPLVDVGTSADEDTGDMVKDIRFSSVKVLNTLDNFDLDIAIYHNQLSTYYHIDIVAPINYY